jgi:hypothetical protein
MTLSLSHVRTHHRLVPPTTGSASWHLAVPMTRAITGTGHERARTRMSSN